MAFVNSVKASSIGYGNPGTYAKREAVATNVGTVTITVPSSGTFSSNNNGPGVSRGRCRVKTVSIVAGGTVQSGIITATNGTLTATLAPSTTALAADTLLDRTVEFNLDFMATSVTFTVIAGTQNSVHDVEVAGVA